MKNYIHHSSLLFALMISSTCALAETVRVPVGHQSLSSSIEVPRHGITKEQTESQFGLPDSKHGPVGEPAIYYWEYSDFTVYFESNYVLHSVIKNTTAKPLGTSG